MNFGISTYTLTWSYGVPGYEPPTAPLVGTDLIRIAHRHGLNLVQYADNYPLHLKDEQELEAIKRYAKQTEIQIELGTRGTIPENLLNYAKICNKLGATLLRTIITDDNMDQAEDDIRKVLPEFQQLGVALAIENHGQHTVEQLTRLFKRINKPSLIGCCLDTVNSFSALESPKEVIEALSPYILNLHIKDFDINRVDHQMGFVVLGTPAGSGKINVPEIMRHLHKLGKQPTAILELWTPFRDSIEKTIAMEQAWMVQSIDYLKSVEN